jgi:alkanesulfonate monooxygenase SsuD/methylene tetrahydromethanopterin reductase-like flavin-dependent oxidoreductase (luciferase family)
MTDVRTEPVVAWTAGPATRGFAILRGDVTDAANTAAEAERLGYHAAWSPEFYTRSAIVSLAAMAQVTSTARIGSSIAYAVGRTPLVLATEARSLDELSSGRLIYGLGTGTTKMMAGWHGVDPAGPASRMEELIPLLRSLWRLHEGPVRHDGRFYHVDVTPTAEMEPPPRTGIPVFTAGVNSADGGGGGPGQRRVPWPSAVQSWLLRRRGAAGHRRGRGQDGPRRRARPDRRAGDLLGGR